MHSRLVSPGSAERVLLEARVVNQVGHPNIVDIFETGTLEDGRPYIVMERLEGVPLSFRADEGKIMPDVAIGILLQVCDALIAAHAAGVIHRDLKLDNVFLLDHAEDPTQPKVKLLDWGIAKVISADVRHTIEGQLVGTPQYLSPEQARGAAVTPQTDVYSLGVMAYELFLEQLPFEAETSAEIMAMHLRCTPPPPSEMWPDIPSTLENLLLAMLAKNPDARPSMLTVAHTLEQVRAELEERKHKAGFNDVAPARPSTRIATVIPFERRSNRFAAAVAGAGLAPTERADEWHEPAPRRLPVVLGALAIAASALLFVFTRETEQAAASTATARPGYVEAGATAAATLETPAPSAKPTLAAEQVVAPLPTGDTLVVAAPAASTTDTAAPSTKSSKRASKNTRKVQVKTRLDKAIDPNGVLDPY